MTVIGYTAKQAASEKRKVEIACAKAADALAALQYVIPDAHVNVAHLQEYVLEIEHELLTTVDRRTR